MSDAADGPTIGDLPLAASLPADQDPISLALIVHVQMLRVLIVHVQMHRVLIVLGLMGPGRIGLGLIDLVMTGRVAMLRVLIVRGRIGPVLTVLGPMGPGLLVVLFAVVVVTVVLTVMGHATPGRPDRIDPMTPHVMMIRPLMRMSRRVS